MTKWKKKTLIISITKNTEAFTLRFLDTKLQTKKKVQIWINLLSRFVKGGWVQGVESGGVLKGGE